MPDQTEGKARRFSGIGSQPSHCVRKEFFRMFGGLFVWWARVACWPSDCERQKEISKKNCYGILLRSSHDDTDAPAVACVRYSKNPKGSMTSLAYKGHNIIAGAKRDQLQKYKPIIHITWMTPDGKRDVHSFALPNAYSTFDEASNFALQAAKLWVDHHSENLN